MTAPDRCPTCDRAIADETSVGTGLCEVVVSFHSRRRRDSDWNRQANKDCAAREVDWRARALAAEADAAKWHRVALLIERLRHTRRHARPGFVVKALDNLLAATEDAP